jgi:hypothetical protein
LGKADAVWRHVTAYDYDAAEPFHVLHMDQISYDAVPNQLPNPHPCQAMQPFGLRLAQICSHCHPILGKADAVWRHVTAYDAAEPLHVLHMDQMSDDA